MRWYWRTVWALAAATFLLWGWYFGSPQWTLHQIRSAALARDVERLARFVDYRELGRNRKADMQARLAKLLAGASPELRRRFIEDGERRRLEGNRNFDPNVRPDDIFTMFGRNPGYWGWASGSGETGRRDSIEVRTPNRFHLIDRRDPYPHPQGDLIFRREGFRWKLVAIRTTYEEFPEKPPAWRLHQWLRL